ncbi:glycoside hydrolase family 3 N-terminal domain-containing protein [Roseibium sp.]|uniref:glycoside hydrolase family 3 N-terminal domain-containing protein n=1 Tax=Roseibium sp. TaxID=1936156 RepID=UPI003D0A7A7C
MTKRSLALAATLLSVPFLFAALWIILFQAGPNRLISGGPEASALERKVGQLIMVGFNGTRPTDPGVMAVSGQLASGRVGGVMLLGRNIQTPDQLTTLTRHLADQGSGSSVLIAVDQEGGLVQRLPPLGDPVTWSTAKDLPAATDNCTPRKVRAYYARRAAQLGAYNINVNFGPVVDVDINPDNPIIGKKKRSFSADPATVTNCAAGFIAAHQAAGIATALKHFPGHGSSTTDSHTSLPVISQSWHAHELEPYRALHRQDRVDMVMMGHLVHPRFSDTPETPASLSKKGIAEARTLAGEDVIIITDDLEMDAVSDRFSIEDAAVQAIAAGNDIVLFSSFDRSDPELGDRVNAAIVAAVSDGRISETQIDQSTARVAALKHRLRRFRVGVLPDPQSARLGPGPKNTPHSYAAATTILTSAPAAP